MDNETFDQCLKAAEAYLVNRRYDILATSTEEGVNNFVCRKDDFLTVAVDLRIARADGTVIYEHNVPDKITFAHLVHHALTGPVNPDNTSLFDFDHCDRMSHDRMNLFLSNNGRVFIEYHPATSLPLPLYVKTEFVQMKTAIECYNTYIQEAFDDEEKIASGWTPMCFDEFIESEEYANMCK